MRLRGVGIHTTTRSWFLVVAFVDWSHTAHCAVL
jgi:hypothetical protein